MYTNSPICFVLIALEKKNSSKDGYGGNKKQTFFNFVGNIHFF